MEEWSLQQPEAAIGITMAPVAAAGAVLGLASYGIFKLFEGNDNGKNKKTIKKSKLPNQEKCQAHFKKLSEQAIADAIRDINGQKREKSFTPKATGSEASYRDRLAAELGGKIEVSTPVGKIDVLHNPKSLKSKLPKIGKVH